MVPRYKTLFDKPYRRYINEKTASKLQLDEDAGVPEVHGSYGALLFDSRWKERRISILERDGHRCAICKDHQELQVHHRQYHFIKELKEFKPPWEYTDNLLVTLCEPCHKKGHSLYKVPIIKL